MVKNSILPTSRIVGIQAGLVSSESIRRSSVCRITTTELYHPGTTIPVRGGLFSPEMGVTDVTADYSCPTDRLCREKSPGYFGHIELPLAVYWYQHLKKVHAVLPLLCFNCSRLLVDVEAPGHLFLWEMGLDERYEYLTKRKKRDKNCPHCDAQQPCKWTSYDICFIQATFPPSGEVEEPTLVLRPDDVRSIFVKVGDTDTLFLGFHPQHARLESLVCTVCPVSPTPVRPSVRQGGNGARAEDDQTSIYYQILCLCRTIEDLSAIRAQKITAKEVTEWQTSMDEHNSYLQYLVACLYTDKINGYTPMVQRSSGRTYSNVKKKLDGKGGRFRGNLCGKRVDFSTRAVIIGDSALKTNEVGISVAVAMQMTIPLRVTASNIEYARGLVQNGTNKYPGANQITCDGVLYTLKAKRNIEPKIGDTIHRHLQTGDIVAFNRQPSLHKLSIMGHTVRVLPYGNAFRMNLSTTVCYNADFDGDEMNIHVPQDDASMVELAQISGVRHQIISPAHPAPIIGFYQDSMMSGYEITEPGLTLSVPDAMQLLSHVPGSKLMELFGATTLKGKIAATDLLSRLFPDTFSIQVGAGVVIQNGKYLGGQLDKSCFFKTTRGILHRIYNDYGAITCSQFMDNYQWMMKEFMRIHSFSLGVSDFMADSATTSAISEMMKIYLERVNALVDSVYEGRYENKTAQKTCDKFEMDINNLLNQLTSEVSKIAKTNMNSTNRLVRMILSGAKGKWTNIAQMVAMFGQQNFEGGRIPFAFTGRTLPYFAKYDLAPETRGFIKNSFVSGLTPVEYLYQCIGGRRQHINTTVKTSETGYLQRRFVTAMVGIMVWYDMTLRNTNGRIVQYRYGDNGTSASKFEQISIRFLLLSAQDLFTSFMTVTTGILLKKPNRTAFLSRQMEVYHSLVKVRDYMLEYVYQYNGYDEEFFTDSPIAFEQVLLKKVGIESHSPNVFEIQSVVHDLYAKYFDTLYWSKPTEMFRALYFYYLNPIELAKKKLSVAQVRQMIGEMRVQYLCAMVSPGELSGIVAAQSDGASATQNNLDSCHAHSGSSSTTVRKTGIERTEELLTIKEDPASPYMHIYPSFISSDSVVQSERTENLANKMLSTTLGDVIDSCTMVYVPPLAQEEDNDVHDPILMMKYRQYSYLESRRAEIFATPPAETFPWILRITLNRDELLRRSISMQYIYFTLRQLYKDNLHCIYSDTNSEQLIMRIALTKTFFRKCSKVNKKKMNTMHLTQQLHSLKLFQETLLEKTVLKGLNGIKGITMKNINMRVRVANDFQRVSTPIIETDGSNLLAVLGTPGVDVSRTWSNDVFETYRVLGKLACRNLLMREFTESTGMKSIHNLSILCNKMTYQADFLTVNRTGIKNDENVDFLMQSTFETHTQVINEAARRGKFDPCISPSASVMIGNRGRFGTSFFSVLLNLQSPSLFKLQREHKLAPPPSDPSSSSSSSNPSSDSSDPDDTNLVEHVYFQKHIDEQLPDEEMPDSMLDF